MFPTADLLHGKKGLSVGVADNHLIAAGCAQACWGAEKVVEHYNIIGPVKAALESTVRYLPVGLGPKNIRVNAMSPGPLETRAASGIDHFDALIDDARRHAPLHRLTTIKEVGALSACLVSDFARAVSGNTAYIDGGHHVV